jgi:hypothetical protein
MLSPLKKQWQGAIMEESNSIIRNEICSPVNLQELRNDFGASPIGSKLVCKTKRNPHGSTRYKARLGIKGYDQLDSGEAYAPVGKLTTFRLLICIAARNNWNIDHLDMVTAFLNPDVDDDSLLKQLLEGWPKGLIDDCPEGEDLVVGVVWLRKALYCLKQVPHLWYRPLNAFLQSLHFFQSEADPNLYIRNKGGILPLLYVDDMLLTYPPQAAKEAEEIKTALAATYKITNLGITRQFLGIEIYRHKDGTISLGQRQFIDSVL